MFVETLKSSDEKFGRESDKVGSSGANENVLVTPPTPHSARPNDAIFQHAWASYAKFSGRFDSGALCAIVN